MDKKEIARDFFNKKRTKEFIRMLYVLWYDNYTDVLMNKYEYVFDESIEDFIVENKDILELISSRTEIDTGVLFRTQAVRSTIESFRLSKNKHLMDKVFENFHKLILLEETGEETLKPIECLLKSIDLVIDFNNDDQLMVPCFHLYFMILAFEISNTDMGQIDDYKFAAFKLEKVGQEILKVHNELMLNN